MNPFDGIPDDIKRMYMKEVERIGKMTLREMSENKAFMDRVRQATESGELKTRILLMTQTSINDLAMEYGESELPVITRPIHIEQKDRDWLARRAVEWDKEGYDRL